MKIEQKIATGGANNTSTPILKFRMKNALLEPASDARHIEHCAKPVLSSSTSKSSAGTRKTTNLVTHALTSVMLFRGWRWRRHVSLNW